MNPAPPRRPRPAAELPTAAVIGLFFFVIYAVLLAPGVGWYDSPEFVGVATALGVAHPTGYPLYALVGRLASILFAPFGAAAVRVNLLSALAGAATVATLVPITLRLASLMRLGPIPRGVRLAAIAVPSALLGTLPLFVEQSVVAEVYTLNTFCAALLLLFGLEAVLQAERPTYPLDGSPDRRAAIWGPAGWRLPLLLAYLAGLGLGNHFTLILYIPAILWLTWWSIRPEAWQPDSLQVRAPIRSMVRRAVPALMIAALGFSIYLLIPVRSGQVPPFNWGGVDSMERFLALITAAEARARPTQFDPVTPLGIWWRIGRGMGAPFLLTSLAGWIWAGFRRPRLGIAAALYLLFPLIFMAWGLDILEDSLLPVHLFVSLGGGCLMVLLSERLVAFTGPMRGRWAAAALIAMLLITGPAVTLVNSWSDIRPSRTAGAEDWIEAVAASVSGSAPADEEARGWVFSEENTTAFLLWHQSRTAGRYPNIRGIYLLLARESWYREDLRLRLPSLEIPSMGAEVARLPHEAAARALVQANQGLGVPLYLSPVILPPEAAYGVLVPQGVLLRIRPEGYGPSQEDIARHLDLIQSLSPAALDPIPGLDRISRDWWSYRHEVLGDAWARLGYVAVAMAEYRAGTKINPDRADSWVALAEYQAAVGDWHGALVSVRLARQLEPKDHYLRFAQARALARTGVWAAADSLLPERPIPGVPDADHLQISALIRSGLNDLTGAEGDLREAARLAPDSGAILNDLGVILLRRGDRDGAAQSFRRGTQLSPDLGEAWYNLGALELDQGDYGAAAQHLRRALQEGVSSPLPGYLIGIARAGLRDLAGAESVLRENVRNWPRHGDSWMELGRLLEARGAVSDAIRVYEQGRLALPEQPRFADALRRLGAIPPVSTTGGW